MTDPRDDLEAPAPEETPSAEAEAPPLPSFPKRVVDVFVAPGRLGAALRERPAWATALFVGAAISLLQLLLIPGEVWEAAFRQVMLQRGQSLPEGFAGGTFMRISSTIGGGLGYLIMAFVMAGVVTLLFAFILGDEGRYKQYLAVVCHAGLIPAIVGLLTVPLKIAQQSPSATLNLGSFFFFLPEGYFLKVLTMLDLSQLWASLVVAAGVHAIDPRRSFKSAAVMLIVLSVLLVMIIAIWAPMP